MSLQQFANTFANIFLANSLAHFSSKQYYSTRTVAHLGNGSLVLVVSTFAFNLTNVVGRYTEMNHRFFQAFTKISLSTSPYLVQRVSHITLIVTCDAQCLATQ